MQNGTGKLGGASGIGAANGGGAFIPMDALSAGGAVFGELIGDGLLGAVLLHHAQNLGNDLSRLTDDHHIPDADVLFPNEALVVQRGAGNGASRQHHGG